MNTHLFALRGLVVRARDPRLDGPVRVMHLLHTFGVGGMEVGITKLVNSLDPGRVSSSICSCCPGDSLKLRLRSDIPLFEFGRRPGQDPRFVVHLWRLLRRERPHILHTHRWATLCEGLIAARLAGVPFVVHGEHGTLETRGRNVPIQRQVWKRVDAVLSVSSRLAERMAREIGFPLERIRVIRNGVDLERFAPGERQGAKRALGLPADRLVIGTVGRLVPVKDQATLLEAFALLRSRGVTFTGVLAGAGPLREALTRRAGELGLDVVFLGNRDDVARVLAAYDVFVLSSESEGLSNTIQEAMACGVPVVATRVGGADELIDESRTGLLVPPREPLALATAIHQLAMDSELRQSFGRAGRQRAETLFGLDRMIRDYESMYLMLARHTPPPLVQAERSEA